jgi:tRNA dimethylallyltransferase
MPTREYVTDTVVVGLRLPREQLDQRIEARVRRMWDDGLVEEVRGLDRLGLRQGRTASRALGYAQALAELDGTMTTGQAQEQTMTMTRRFARRQESWFSSDPRIHWLDATAPDLLERALTRVTAAIGDNGAHG